MARRDVSPGLQSSGGPEGQELPQAAECGSLSPFKPSWVLGSCKMEVSIEELPAPLHPIMQRVTLV